MSVGAFSPDASHGGLSASVARNAAVEGGAGAAFNRACTMNRRARQSAKGSRWKTRDIEAPFLSRRKVSRFSCSFRPWVFFMASSCPGVRLSQHWASLVLYTSFKEPGINFLHDRWTAMLVDERNTAP